jgi:hypothetical protein
MKNSICLCTTVVKNNGQPENQILSTLMKSQDPTPKYTEQISCGKHEQIAK